MQKIEIIFERSVIYDRFLNPDKATERTKKSQLDPDLKFPNPDQNPDRSGLSAPFQTEFRTTYRIKKNPDHVPDQIKYRINNPNHGPNESGPAVRSSMDHGNDFHHVISHVDDVT